VDLFSRRIVGWHLDHNMTEQLVLKALRSAIKEWQPGVRLIHHTDRGGQYAGNEYRSLLRRADIKQSMSLPDHCYDNAFMESCFGTIKNELVVDGDILQVGNTKEVGNTKARVVGVDTDSSRHKPQHRPIGRLEMDSEIFQCSQQTLRAYRCDNRSTDI